MKKQILFRRKVKLVFHMNPVILGGWDDIVSRNNRI